MISQPSNPLHIISLHKIVFELSQEFGWEEMSKAIHMHYFYHNLNLNSLLKSFSNDVKFLIYMIISLW